MTPRFYEVIGCSMTIELLKTLVINILVNLFMHREEKRLFAAIVFPRNVGSCRCISVAVVCSVGICTHALPAAALAHHPPPGGGQ